MDERRSSVEANRQALLAGRQTKAESDGCLAGAAVICGVSQVGVRVASSKGAFAAVGGSTSRA